MVRMDRLAPEGVELYGKLESLNPGGVGQGPHRRRDDRGRRARRSDRARPDDDRGGHQRQHRHRARVRLRREGLRARAHPAAGDEPRARGPAAALRRARADHRVDGRHERGGRRPRAKMAADPDVFLPDQFSNPANPEIHRRTTGPEILEALDDRVDVFVAGVGTGGTITGVGECLKERNPRRGSSRSSPRARAVLSGRPAGPHKIQGIGAGFVPAVLNREVLDEIIPVPDEAAIETARLAARARGRALRAVRAARRSGARCRWPRGRGCRASGSWRCCRTPASATSRRRSSRPVSPRRPPSPATAPVRHRRSGGRAPGCRSIGQVERPAVERRRALGAIRVVVGTDEARVAGRRARRRPRSR